MSKFTKKIVHRPISSLRPHPKQATLFCALSKKELEELAKSLEKGQQNPVEILPDGTIICGHQRVAAAQMLGWPTIRCWVRHDLSKQGDAAVESRLIEDNLLRRQLSKVATARVAMSLKEIEQEARRHGNGAEGELRDYLSERLGMDGVNLERWMKLTKLPVKLDVVFDQNLLTYQRGYKLLSLPPGKLQNLTEEIIGVLDGDESRPTKKRLIHKIVDSAVGSKPTTKTDSPHTWSSRLCKGIERSLRDAPDKITSVRQTLNDSDVGQNVLQVLHGELDGVVKTVKGVSLSSDTQRILRESLPVLAALLLAAEAGDRRVSKVKQRMKKKVKRQDQG